MDLSKLPDWRVAKAAELATDSVLPGGAPVAKGSLVLLTTVTEDSRLGKVHFPTPGAPSLAISIAAKSAKRAVALRRDLDWKRPLPADGRTIEFPQVPLLFDFFEEAMMAATFSFQALESFSNQLIADLVEGTFTLARKEGPKEFNAAELERAASTEEKLAIVLPALTQVPSPKGKAIWGHFKRLKGVRDSTIHLKSSDHYRRMAVDRDSLFYRFLQADTREFPRLAIDLMRYFSGGWGVRWLDAAQAELDAGAADV